jgi:phosphoenolpyruvate synthase/pyruvate phosphate dikinase
MRPTLVRPLAGLGAADQSAGGSKAASLRETAAGQRPVPPGCVVTTARPFLLILDEGGYSRVTHRRVRSSAEATLTARPR